MLQASNPTAIYSPQKLSLLERCEAAHEETLGRNRQRAYLRLQAKLKDLGLEPDDARVSDVYSDTSCAVRFVDSEQRFLLVYDNRSDSNPSGTPQGTSVLTARGDSTVQPINSLANLYIHLAKD